MVAGGFILKIALLAANIIFIALSNSVHSAPPCPSTGSSAAYVNSE